MIKKVLSTFLSLSIIALCPLTAFAMVATPSEAMEMVATPSDALPSQDYMETDDFDTLDFVPFSDAGMPSVSNTVSYTGLRLVTEYYDMHGVLREAFVPFNSEFYASIGLPNDCVSVLGFRVRLLKASLPASGTYKMSVRFGSNTGLEYYDCYVNSTKGNSNAAPQYNDAYINFVQQSGDWYTDLNIDVGSVNFIDVGVHVKDTATTVYPYGGYVSVSFIKTTVSPDYTTAGGSQTSQDVQSNIADNTAQQVEQGDTIIELIKNTIQTISSQLTAFWNQLAGEFTNLFNKMNQQHTEQLEADRTNTEDIIAVEESNTTNIINNNNANTDKLAYGYDSSAQDQKNDQLGNKLNEYDSAESEIFDSVSGNISDFNMDDYKIEDSSLLAGIVWVSDFMQQLFVSMGLFNLPVTISLVLIFVVIMIGYYRIRS